MTIETKIMEVNPALAQEWLKKNHSNRKLDWKRVKIYSSAMRLGTWVINNDDICLDPHGVLLNGQHRLHAVIDSDCTVTMAVKFNVPTGSMGVMDRGKPRKYSDQLRFQGEQSVALLAATLRLGLQLSLGMADGGTKGDADHNLFLMQHPEIRESVALADRVKSYVSATPTSIATAHWLIGATQMQKTEAVNRYFAQLAKPVYEPDGSAVLAVNSRLLMILRQQQKVQNRDYVQLFVKGWNAYSQGKRLDMRRLYVRRKDEPFAMPEIKQATWPELLRSDDEEYAETELAAASGL